MTLIILEVSPTTSALQPSTTTYFTRMVAWRRVPGEFRIIQMICRRQSVMRKGNSARGFVPLCGFNYISSQESVPNHLRQGHSRAVPVATSDKRMTRRFNWNGRCGRAWHWNRISLWAFPAAAAAAGLAGPHNGGKCGGNWNFVPSIHGHNSQQSEKLSCSTTEYASSQTFWWSRMDLRRRRRWVMRPQKL